MSSQAMGRMRDQVWGYSDYSDDPEDYFDGKKRDKSQKKLSEFMEEKV